MAHGEHYKPKRSLFPLYDAYVLFLYWNFVFLVSVLIVFFFSFDKVQVHAWPHTCTVHRVLWSATLLPLDLCLLTWCRNSKNLQLGTLFVSLTFTSAPSFIVQYLYVHLLPWTLFFHLLLLVKVHVSAHCTKSVAIHTFKKFLWMANFQKYEYAKYRQPQWFCMPGPAIHSF